MGCVCVCGVQGAVALCKPRAVACERVRDACWGTLMQQASEARVRVGVAQIVGRAWVVRLQRDRRAYSASCQGRMQCAGGGFAVLRSVTRAGETLCAVQALVALLGPRASAGALRSRGMQVAQAHRGHGECVCVLRVLAVRVACVCAADGRWKRCMRTGATIAPRSFPGLVVRGGLRSRSTQVAQVCIECGERVCAIAHAGCAARVRLCDRRALEMLSVQWGASSTAKVGFGCGEGLCRAGRWSRRRRQVMRSACACGACWLCDFAGQCSI